MELGQKLKDARLKVGLTQETVAQTIGVSRQSMSNWENNRSYPDLASVLKLSDLYGISLDVMLKDDMALRRKLEERRERTKRYGSLLHDFAMLLIGSTILLVWLGKTSLGIALGVTGILLICAVHLLFVLRLDADWKTMGLRCGAMAMWFSGFMIRILSSHSSIIGDVLWFSGIALHWYGSGHMKWEEQYPRHMTVFTGFVIAMVLVFGTIPFVGDSIERGDHIESNPFNSRDYRVAQVLEGDRESLPMVYLGNTSSVYLDYPEEEAYPLEGEFTYITQPEGAKQKGLWEMIPENDSDVLYRIAVELDDSVTMACLEKGQVQWKYRLEPSPLVGCTILDVLGTITGTVDWYYDGAFDAAEPLGGFPLRGKGTIKLSVPGDSSTVTIQEEFRDGNSVEHQTMTLTKDKRGFVEFERATRKNGKKQTGIYRIPYEDGEFVLVLNFVP